jgi:hypothetical protein
MTAKVKLPWTTPELRVIEPTEALRNLFARHATTRAVPSAKHFK